ncbi:MAG: hypothetical protein ACYTXY_46455, partial [Nostoc sp.]
HPVMTELLHNVAPLELSVSPLPHCGEMLGIEKFQLFALCFKVANNRKIPQCCDLNLNDRQVRSHR